MVEGEKVIPINAVPQKGEVRAKEVKALGRDYAVEMVPHIAKKPIEIKWVKNYDKLRGK